MIAEVDARPLGFIQIMDPARDETQYWGEAEPGIRAIDIWIGIFIPSSAESEEQADRGVRAEIVREEIAKLRASGSRRC